MKDGRNVKCPHGERMFVGDICVLCMNKIKPMEQNKEDPDKVLKHMFNMYLETKESYRQHLYYQQWLTDYFNKIYAE